MPVVGLDGLEAAHGQPGHATDRDVAAARDRAHGGGGLGQRARGGAASVAAKSPENPEKRIDGNPDRL
ncbi:hypothetical protein [uncultured Thiodictyon sp.]|uniref:hypothetical protein n=1 Tax=uncultured Thiodictyon sp. TaxID=1846217 RepID=UPI0025D9157A|nr:hypothetical protein [uncultured Thiodictyon sp.]